MPRNRTFSEGDAKTYWSHRQCDFVTKPFNVELHQQQRLNDQLSYDKKKLQMKSNNSRILFT